MFWRSKIASPKGRRTEQQALVFLQNQGLVLCQQNYACKCGEIDLIMQDGDVLVFVEVRFRSHSCFGTPEESVDYRKQQRLIRTAGHFLQTFRLTDKHPCRFDVITCQPALDSGLSSDSHQTINWLKNAFEC